MTEAPRAYDALLGLGSNIGDKLSNIERALDLLCADGAIRLVRRSRAYRTAAWGKTDQDWFVNICASIATALDPHALLVRCLGVEQQLGRVRRERWGPRIVDIDILTYRDAIIDTADLKIPHPLIEQRAFVLVPLVEIAPDETVRGVPVSQLVARVGRGDVEQFTPQ